jgi:hypothetical protein
LPSIDFSCASDEAPARQGAAITLWFAVAMVRNRPVFGRYWAMLVEQS